MRDHAIRGPASLGAAEARPDFLARMFRNWKARRRLARLSGLDDHLLDDIGLSRDELNWALSVPLTHNPFAELEQSAFRRRLEQARKRPGWGAY